MKNKVILISIDGMRPDGFLQSGSDFADFLLKHSAYTLSGKSVNPPITLPAHLSMFTGVTPDRHCTFSNDYVKPVHPVENLFSILKNHDKKNAMFHAWEPLRHVTPLGSMKYVNYFNAYETESADTLLTDDAISLISRKKPDFVFLHLVETDEKGGHDNSWMSDAYLNILKTALDNAGRLYDTFKEEYDFIITADHGGHDRMHGTDSPEDMTVPMFFLCDGAEVGEIKEECGIIDIGPTVLRLFDIPIPVEWDSNGIAGLIK